MKNQNKILIVGVVILFLCSSVAVGINNSTIDVGIDSFEDIILEFTFSKPTIEKIEINSEMYDRVTMDGLPNSGDLQKPRLPVKPVKILVPYDRELDSIDVVVTERSFLGLGYNIEVGQNIIPIKSDLEQQSSIKNPEEISSEHSGHFFSIVDTHIFRGYQILFINLYPVQYTVETGELVYYKHIALEVKTKESQSRNIIRGLQKDKDLVTALVDNPSCVESYGNIPTSINEETVQYVIITNEDLAAATGDYTFSDLVQSKIDKGMSADIFTVEDIVSHSEYWVDGVWGDNNPSNPFYESEITTNFSRFNDTQAKIRNFIRYAYTELGTDYVLLGGDADEITPEDNIVPQRALYACEEGLPLNVGLLGFEEDDIPSDVYYACLDGNFNYDMDLRWGENATNNNVADVEEADLLAEVYVGRACVDSEEEISNFVLKTLGYENSDEASYLGKVLMVGEYLGFPGVSAYGGNYKDLIIPIIPDDYNVDTLYERDTNWNKYDIINILNTATPHLINHLGHGWIRGTLQMDISDVSSLTNNNYFFLYSQSCLTGSFDNWDHSSGYIEEDCFAEHLTVGTPHGAFAVILNARYGLGSENSLYSPSQALDESFFNALFTENIRELGRASHYSKEDHIWHINENGIRWVFYETNLFGDPELAIKDPSSSNIELEVDIIHPEDDGILYLLNRRLFKVPLLQVPLIIGKITVQAEASSDPEGEVFSVEFLLDNESQFVDYEEPYEWELNSQLFGRHTITAAAHGNYGEKESTSIEIITTIFGL